MAGNELILVEVQRNIERGRAVATGIGVFAAVIKKEESYQGEDGSPAPRPTVSILLRRRQEKGSLFGTDLLGKWELPGGGVELDHFKEGNYRAPVLNALRQKLREETGLRLSQNRPLHLALRPAWIFNQERGIIDLAFVTVLPLSFVEETDEYESKKTAGGLRFFRSEDLGHIK